MIIRLLLKVGEMLLLISVSNQLAPLLQNIQHCYIKPWRNIKNAIKKRVESHIEDENPENKSDQSDWDGKLIFSNAVKFASN